MKFIDSLNQGFKYLSEAILRIFSPREEAYPEIGVQPFAGDPYQEN
jgi:hypothetical protein